MKTKKKEIPKVDNVPPTKKAGEERLSKIAQFMASRTGKGEIINMRAVLK
jgi:hypothetical protein